MKGELLDRDRTVLVVIDVQERLFPQVHEKDQMLTRIDLLLSAAKTMGVPLVLTEQYPKGLGSTIPEIHQIFPEVQPVVKLDFSCIAAGGFIDRIAALERDQILLAGIETHICVAQTALDLASMGKDVYIAADATSSRRRLDAQVAIQRMARCGISITTAEAAVFEWLRRAGTEEFKSLQAKIKNLT